MQLAIVNSGDSCTSVQFEQLTHAMAILDVDLVIFTKVIQHSEYQQILLTHNQYILQDGISKVYGDNLAFHLHVQCKQFLSAIFWTNQIYTNHHAGQAVLCRESLKRVWFRQLNPMVKLVVIDMPKVVCAFVSTKLPNRIGEYELLCITDLLKAQVKPVILIIPQLSTSSIANNQDFVGLNYHAVESIILTDYMLLTDFGFKQIIQKQWQENGTIILIELVK